MPNKTFWLEFGTALGASFSGLTPSFILFQSQTGTTLAPPAGITERIAGTGAYQFDYDINGSTIGIFFRVDGGVALDNSVRYISGVLDPILAVDQSISSLTTSVSGIGTTLTAQGATIVAIGSTLLGIGSTLVIINSTITSIDGRNGSTTATFGDNTTDPSTLFGYVRRGLEFSEGNARFNKITGGWSLYSRGSSTLLREKLLTNTSTAANKT